jgi:hypothetical protein
MASGQRHPDFVIVCDHGGRGGQLDRVARLPWFADRPGWWGAESVDEAAIRIWAMEGEERGHDPKWFRPEWTSPDEPDLRRLAIEIICTAPHCSRRSYRSDDDKLQTLLTMIATDDRFRAVFTIEASESVIVMTLDQLEMARDAACTRLHLDI